MNLNYFVVVPNKPNSMKMKGRNLPELHLDAVQLDQESRIIESRLQQLREDMSREKEEREKSGGFRWKSVKATSQGATKTKENSFQKLSAGKVKMRVLKGEPEEPGRPTGKAPRPPPGEQAASRKPRLRGKPCGQCEASAARLMCAECGEDYCVGCFARFHQKGALKNHRMIPIQMEIQTSISALDVVSQFKRQIEPEGSAVNSKRKDAKWSQGALRSKPSSTTLPQTQLLLVKNDGVKERGEAESQHRQNLLCGEYDEKESERSFQEALWEWRGQGGVSEVEPVPELEVELEPEVEVDPEPDVGPEDLWGLKETLKAPTEVFAAQADLVQRGRPIEVEFREHGLSYMEKLLVKKHRRTPIEEYRPLPAAGPYQESQADAGRVTGEEELTAEEMEMQRYCASLFATDAAPSTTASTSASASTSSFFTGSNQQDSPAKSCLSMVELEQMAGDSAVLNSTFTAELETDNGMMPEAEGIAMEPGHQETKRSKEPTDYHPVNQLPRPPGFTPSPQKCRSHLTQSPQAPLSPTPPPPSPRSSTSRSARVMTTSLDSKPTLRKTSWSAPCQIRPPQSAVASRQSSPSPLSSRPQSTGSSVRNPLPSRFKLTRPSPPEWPSRAKTTSSPPSTPLSSRSMSYRSISTGSLPPTPLPSRDKSAESPLPDFTSRPKATASPPSTAQSYRSLSTGSSPPTPLPSRDKSAESPLPDFTSRPKATVSPPSIAQSFRSVSNGLSLSRDKSSELPSPELNFRSKSHHSPPLELTIRGKSPGSPPLQQTLKSKSTGSSPPTPVPSRDKSPESPLPEQDFRDKSASLPLPELSFRGKSPGSTLAEQDFRDESAEFSFRDELPELTVPEQDFRNGSPGLPLPELSCRDKSPGGPLAERDINDESAELSLRAELPESTVPEQDFKNESLRLPLPEQSCRDKSPGSTLAERDFRDELPISPIPELNFRDKSLGTTLHEPAFKDKSLGLPLPEPSFRDKSPESPPPKLASKYKSTESLPPTPLSTRSGSPPPFEQPSMSIRFLQSASLSEPTQFVLTETPQPPLSANRLSPTLSSAPQSRAESASCSETPSGSPEQSPRWGDEDEEISARAGLGAQGHGEQMGHVPQPPRVPLGTDPDSALGSGLDPEPDMGTFDQPVFFSDPSLALHSLAYRPVQYTGLEGFLTLGLDPEAGRVSPGPLSAHKSQECEDPVERLVGGPESWRPGSSLRDCADERLVLGVLSGRPISISPRTAKPRLPASPLQRSGFSGAVEARPWSARNSPRAARPISAGLSARPHPRPRPQSSPWPRPQSRAAKEISEIECVDRMESDDPLLGDEADCLALANLEEEFRLMSRRGTCSSDPGASSPAQARGGLEASRERAGSKRKESAEGHADEEEEEILRDKLNVALLP
ncbi:proline-rich protein 36 isoform X2 [Anguilla anguilla]|uniref:proline-rich protein 36 isoform X2 n=1 Tax=Anguilla anguilla TaxID=7936 RepID=UPI0015B0E627|nr:proline-rich protein 36 isoform X2 [Anguilla anguilla]